MAKRRKRHITRHYLPARRHHRLSDGLGALSLDGFMPSILGAVTGIAAGFVDNAINIDPKIKGGAMIIGSALIPAPDSIKGAIAGKGGELVAKGFGILSDELDGFIAISEEEMSEIAEAIADEMADDVITDPISPDVINDEVMSDAV